MGGEMYRAGRKTPGNNDSNRAEIPCGETYRAGRPVLGARLLAAAKAVDASRPAADIGCDHGKLAVWLAFAGCPKVVAVDNRPMPLEKARALVRQTGTGGVVDCRLGDGLTALCPGETDEIVVAGLSGVTMGQLLAPFAWLRDKGVHLVLVPASRHPELRRWLCENGFGIAAETPVLERGRAYTVISARYTGEKHTPNGLFCQLGLVRDAAGEAAQTYIRARLKNLARQRAAPMDDAARAAHEQLIKEVEVCLL